MRQSLQTGAEQILDRLELTENKNNRNWCVINGDLLDYIPGNIRPTFKKGKVLRRRLRDFTTTFIEYSQAVRCPTTRNLMTSYKRKRAWPQMQTFYFSPGGSIEAATNFSWISRNSVFKRNLALVRHTMNRYLRYLGVGMIMSLRWSDDRVQPSHVMTRTPKLR
ncbi:hypothetical protein BO83DRAFT_95845 [Aspergillus eucalypticola CBS 122712]|uniref:Uncharacterized protein n=1 Tax=Aspergillus eucalypticola (strain CBS 122712 / IBT 29274) TaxID=1448314 RepID=A0A317V6N2_ASPEC|nr:uncharacterized protein BO83DRAFT_95845 [Aspergillus eucalypticola CBS 122712]PWY67810.1 hypothetical protein BO83DRAFT_95845 [Aspergillus eucalypticola CBS 122712]